MKKLSIITFMLVGTLLGCSSNENSEEIKPSNKREVNLFDRDEMNHYGNLHSEGLTYIIREFEDEINIRSFKDSNNEIDTVALLNFVKMKTVNFLSDKKIKFQGNEHSASKSLADLNFIDLQFVRNLHAFETDRNKSQFFNDKISQINNSLTKATSYADLYDRLNIIENDANNSAISEIELTIILVTSAIAKDSYKYWYESDNFENELYSSRGWFSLAVADAAGGYKGAIWGGVVAGPLGAGVVGINAAIIASSVAYLSSRI
ncbi:hypothetical protein [Myroides indicus]|uniref:Uncharacterized protein n=1 Tax=Myroides indicus TaxID=1323422 RepID=A0A4R7EY82_9FLAO|nr:hypothetical protein [Myroides indicus]TDS60204.1 hypothetical protein C8P70_10961 [Myroides indicus]